MATLASTMVYPQGRFDNVNIKTTQVNGQVYMLEGAGGNIMLWITEEGVLMVDSQFAPLSDKIKTAINDLTDQPIIYLVNTHHHGDHTGGNAQFNDAQATLIAHQNVYKRLQADGKETGFLPESTIEDSAMLEMASDEIILIHLENAHTDGDSFVYLPRYNVLHTGDMFFNGRYPFIDLQSGGSIDGYIKAQETMLELINPSTNIIPGHGALGSFENLGESVKMLRELKSKISLAIEEKRTRDEVINDSSLTKYYDDLGFGNGYIDGVKIRTTLYDGLYRSSGQ